MVCLSICYQSPGFFSRLCGKRARAPTLPFLDRPLNYYVINCHWYDHACFMYSPVCVLVNVKVRGSMIIMQSKLY